MRVVLVSGGVISGIGKGIIASSAGLLLKTAGLKVTAIKIDPYLNVDAGTLGPLEHGECFVLADGGESDLDLGNYERYLGIQLTRDNNITTGKIYQSVIERERRGDYLGRTVQVVPHITDAIQDWILRVANIPVDNSGEAPDVCIIELGGTIGDIESSPFVEALVQLRHKLTRDPDSSFFNIHVSFVPLIHGEEKTKPTQHAIKQMRSAGMIPDLVIGVHDMETIYQVPLLLHEQGLLQLLQRGLELDKLTRMPAMVSEGQSIWELWKKTIVVSNDIPPVEIALVGKYTQFMDSYLSTIKALEHSAMRCNRRLTLVSVDSEHLGDEMQNKDPIKYEQAWKAVKKSQGIVVPGGFGSRGTEGMIACARWARENKRNFLGICLGMQIATIEVARSLCGRPNATSEEFENEASKDPENWAIVFMPESSKEHLGGTMRLGTRATYFQPGSEWSKLRALYGGASVVEERHRHRYEVNPEYIEELQKAGLCFIGKDETGRRMEAFELKDHPFYVGVQAHPEFTSKVTQCSLPFLGLVASSAGILDKIIKELEEEQKMANGVST
ncbi:CTP synthase [Cladobotryum mycophilum]|uniref:CTP synthase n=1 Tax=Cladobotryum mycophilum TaxID=491253 RepID=A0ABR0T1Y9_9HYPO